MISVLSVWFLSCMQENLMVLIAFYLVDYLNKHLLKIFEKMQFASRTLKGQSLQKVIPHYSSIWLSYSIPEMFTIRFSTLHCESKCHVHTPKSN